jgi:hypothetical protein
MADDLRTSGSKPMYQQIVTTVLEEIRNGKYTPSGAGSFRRRIFAIAHYACINQDKKRRRSPGPLSRTYPDVTAGIPDDIMAVMPGNDIDYDEINERVAEIRAFLDNDELEIMKLLSKGKTYKEILVNSIFSKFTIAYLKLKIYNIRKKAKMEKLIEQFHKETKSVFHNLISDIGCHSEPFICHSESFVCHSERSEESQDKLREESHYPLRDPVRGTSQSRPFAPLRVTGCKGYEICSKYYSIIRNE